MGPGPGVMEPDENFCLRWNDYEKKYAETFRTLREDDHFAGELITFSCHSISPCLSSDVTLACEGAAVKAHRIILCACSGYFSQLLRTIHPTQHPVLLLSDVRPNDLTSLMDFIYFGQVNITQDSLQSFLKIAEKLKIKGLCERTLLQPDPAIHQAVAITLPIKDEKKPVGAGQGAPSSGQGLLQHQNFESLLGRSPGTFIQTDPNGQQVMSDKMSISRADPVSSHHRLSAWRALVTRLRDSPVSGTRQLPAPPRPPTPAPPSTRAARPVVRGAGGSPGQQSSST